MIRFATGSEVDTIHVARVRNFGRSILAARPRSLATSIPATRPRSLATSIPATRPRSLATNVPAARPRSLATNVPAARPRSLATSVLAARVSGPATTTCSTATLDLFMILRLCVLLSLCVLAGCGQERSEPGDGAPPRGGDPAADTAFILPGAFSAETTVSDLRTIYGSANVKVASVPDGWGGHRTGLVLFQEDPTRRAFVTFHDQESQSGLAGIFVRDAGSHWRGKHGVHIGMSFAELRRTNGTPFGYSGFDHDHRGWAEHQWSLAPLGDEDSKLGALDVEEGERMYFGVDLGLRGQVSDLPADAYPHDEVSISSDDPRFPRFGELVEVTAFRATTSLDDEWN